MLSFDAARRVTFLLFKIGPRERLWPGLVYLRLVTV